MLTVPRQHLLLGGPSVVHPMPPFLYITRVFNASIRLYLLGTLPRGHVEPTRA